MKHSLVVSIGLALAGCESAKPSPELSTPDAAARCQVAAIKAKSLESWDACFHPRLRGQLAKRKKPPEWDELARKAAPLESVKASDFKIGQIDAKLADWGDQQAEYRLPDNSDSFHAVREHGQWFVVDSGI